MVRIKYKGFTLVELLVVISIIALLLAILMPSLQKAREQAKRTVCLNHIKTLALSTILYAEDNDGKIPPVATRITWLNRDDVSCHWLYLEYPDWDSITAAGPVGLGYLITSGLIDHDSDIIFCPSARRDLSQITSRWISGQKWNSHGDPAHWNYLGENSPNGWFLRPEHNSLEWINIACTYGFRSMETQNITKLSQAKTMAFISDRWMATGEDWVMTTPLDDVGHAPLNAAYGQLNAAYTDGHAESVRLQPKGDYFTYSSYWDKDAFIPGTTWKDIFGR